MRPVPLVLCLALAACVAAKDGFKPYDWKLVSIGGQPFAANATMALNAQGDGVFGQAPCNLWSGTVVKTPFPEWKVRNVVATEMACDALAAETAFFEGLAKTTHQVVGIGYLTLTDQQGFTMEFVPAAP